MASLLGEDILSAIIDAAWARLDDAYCDQRLRLFRQQALVGRDLLELARRGFWRCLHVGRGERAAALVAAFDHQPHVIVYIRILSIIRYGYSREEADDTAWIRLAQRLALARPIQSRLDYSMFDGAGGVIGHLDALVAQFVSLRRLRITDVFGDKLMIILRDMTHLHELHVVKTIYRGRGSTPLTELAPIVISPIRRLRLELLDDGAIAGEPAIKHLLRTCGTLQTLEMTIFGGAGERTADLLEDAYAGNPNLRHLSMGARDGTEHNILSDDVARALSRFHGLERVDLHGVDVHRGPTIGNHCRPIVKAWPRRADSFDNLLALISAFPCSPRLEVNLDHEDSAMAPALALHCRRDPTLSHVHVQLLDQNAL